MRDVRVFFGRRTTYVPRSHDVRDKHRTRRTMVLRDFYIHSSYTGRRSGTRLRSTVNKTTYERRMFDVWRDVRRKLRHEGETNAFKIAMNKRRTIRRTPMKIINILMYSTRIRRYFERRTNNEM